jgi:enamine deaminase RidA (YjgF/YER057c/UK114 family)
MLGRGRVLAIAGQIAWDEQCRIVSDDFVAQFRQAAANVVAVVRAAGGSPADVVSITIYVVDRTPYLAAAREIGQVWRELFGRHYPAMALVVVAGLLEERAQVEIQGLALLPDEPTGASTETP